MTQSNTAPAGAANRRSRADGTGTCAPHRARLGSSRTGIRVVAALVLGLAANSMVAGGALAPAAAEAVARAAARSPAVPEARPASCCVPALAPALVAADAAAGLATRIGATEIRDAVTQVVAAATAAPRGIASVAATAKDALERETRTVRFGEMRVERWIVTAVTAAATQTGADPVFMLALADKESSLRPGVGASTSSAEGLYQFIEQTWLEVLSSFGPKHGLAEVADAITRNADGRYTVADAARREEILALRRNPLIAGLMAGEMLARDRALIEEDLGRRLAPHEVYLAHFLGRGGATRFLVFKDGYPDAPASAEFEAAARANRAIFFEGGTRPRSYAEVHALFAEVIGERVDRYAAVDPWAEAPRARRLARLLAQETAYYASLKGDQMEMRSPKAEEEAIEAVVFAAVAGKDGESVPLPPRRALSVARGG
jgi:hypothetical protein